MTGYGEAHRQSEGGLIAVELRAINSRYFKATMRLPEGYAQLEPRIEESLRAAVRRGAVQFTLRIDRPSTADDYRINEAVLAGYRRQLQRFCETWKLPEGASLDALVALPGVVEQLNTHESDHEEEWPTIRAVIEAALESLAAMRLREGRAMGDSLLEGCNQIEAELDQIALRAPGVVDSYRTRITERLTALLTEHGAALAPGDLAREVGLFAERCDISEEIVRLRSHLVQFREYMQSEEAAGRRLEFLTQEMFRETNTIGSKANDAVLARHVIEIKAAIERMREMIQNVE